MPSTISAGTTAGTAIAIAGDTTGNLAFQTNGTTTAMTINTSQNVGIGTTSPSARLHVTQSGNPIAQFTRSDSGTGLVIASDSDGPYFRPETSSAIRFNNSANTVENMRITSGGYLGLGITNPNCNLDISGSNSASSYQTVNIYNSAATSTSKNNNRIVRVASNANGADACIQITDSVANNYFFGGNNGGAYVVANSGGVRLTNTATSWTSDSDERLKNITGTYSNALNDIAKIQPIKFTWKSDKLNTPQVGVTAQSVQLVVPEAVSATQSIEGDETEYLGVRYTELIPLMIASIQELKAELDATKAEVQALKGVA